MTARPCGLVPRARRGISPAGSLERDRGAGAFEGFLRLVSGGLVDLLEDGIGSRLAPFLALLQTDGSQRADLSDAVDLLVTRAHEETDALALHTSLSAHQ